MIKQWVIPDIHGYLETLKALIEDKIKPSRSDIIYFLGDYIDRGPDSKGVIDYIMELKEDDYNIRTLRGNHEDYLLRVFDNENTQKNFLGIKSHDNLKKEWYKYGGKVTLKSFGISDVHDMPAHYIQWMRELEYFIPLDHYILVHAGFNFEIEDPFSDKESMLWIKNFKVDPLKIGSKKVIHGHAPVSLEFITMLKSTNKYHYIDLDNGIYTPQKAGFGNLVALELTSMEMKVQTNLEIFLINPSA